jgi:DNA-binding GntR family transcriptional regulator
VHSQPHGREPISREDAGSAVTIDSKPSIRHTENHLLVDAITAGSADAAQALALAHVEFGRSPTLAALPTHPSCAPPA